jgi:hypothetical protein
MHVTAKIFDMFLWAFGGCLSQADPKPAAPCSPQ